MTRTHVPAVLVTGATDRVGRLVIDRLLDAGVQVRALARRPAAAATLPPNVEVVTGDLTEPKSLDADRRGIDAAFLVWTAPPATAAAVVERLATHTQRVVFLSAPHRTAHPFFQQPNPMAAHHAEIERLIAASGLPSTIVRPRMFASNALPWWAPAIRAGDAVRWSCSSAETAPIDDADVASVAALALQQDRHVGGDYVLASSESLSRAAQVGSIGDVVGRRIAFEELSPDEFRRETEGSRPRRAVEMLLAAWGETVGTPAFVTSTVSAVPGTAPRTFREWVVDHAAAFEAGPPATEPEPHGATGTCWFRGRPRPDRGRARCGRRRRTPSWPDRLPPQPPGRTPAGRSLPLRTMDTPKAFRKRPLRARAGR